ncbi:MAG: TMEM175 family protein [Ferruginibacter sp.]
MEQDAEQEITRDEIKKEFQLERMILFSDAVFAIVITLMAMEIKIPESDIKITTDTLPDILLHLLPMFFAYCVSFIFIGVIWFNHLKIFSILKNYDKGLVVRNLLLLFFIGLFPFCASVITRAKSNMIAFFMYLGIILCCMIAQYFLYHYIVVTKPALRVNTGIEEHRIELHKRKIALIGFVIIMTLIAITYMLIPDPELKSMSSLWMVGFSFYYKIMTKKKATKKVIFSEEVQS